MKNEISIRIASIQDAEKLLAIYSPYVEQTAITFEYDVPTLDEFKHRMENVLEKYPYLVAELEGEIVGYAYASPFKARAAYAWSVETSIYVRQDMKEKRIGSLLYEELERLLKLQGILNVNACIAYPEEEDEYLTLDSVKFHEKKNYTLVGEFHKCGYKYDRWYGMVWMEKFIGEHIAKQPEVIPFSELKQV